MFLDPLAFPNDQEQMFPSSFNCLETLGGFLIPPISNSLYLPFWMLLSHALTVLLPHWWRCEIVVFFLTERNGQPLHKVNSLKCPFFLLSLCIFWFWASFDVFELQLIFLFVKNNDIMRFNHQMHPRNGGVMFRFIIVVWLKHNLFLINNHKVFCIHLTKLQLFQIFLRVSSSLLYKRTQIVFKGFL